MGILDRMMDKGRNSTPLALESSTPAPEAEAVVYRRLNSVLDYVSKMVPADAKGAKIAQRIGREMVGDLSEVPPEIVEFYIKQLAGMMFWCATGETLDGVVLPEDFERVE
ncbi:MAG TPA: hypothetical protein VIY48_12740 [Candidatus Paceibacterota bacterium]